MSAHTKRPTQKELRQPDEFVNTSRRLIEWGQANQRVMASTAAVLIGVLLLVGFVGWRTTSKSEAATRKFYTAIELYRVEQWEEAGEDFESLADEFGGTEYGKLGQLYAARTAAHLGEEDKAIGSYRAFLSAAPTLALEQLARLNLGRALAKAGDLQGAQTELQAALALEGPARPEATLELAELYRGKGEEERAREFFEAYLEQNPRGPGGALARTQVLALGGELPEEAVSAPFGANPLSLQTQ